MKPYIAAVATLAVLGLALAGLAVTQRAAAGKPPTAKALDGSYHFAMNEIFRTASGPVYCNGYGIITFDGVGAAAITSDAAVSYGVCSDGVTNPIVATEFTYEVAADGSVLLTEESSLGNTTHCQILDSGKLLLCDGTGGRGGVLPPDRLLFVATAGKL